MYILNGTKYRSKESSSDSQVFESLRYPAEAVSFRKAFPSQYELQLVSPAGCSKIYVQ
jgi:hypothetical protein